MTVITRKKLIEVALPLDAINAASAREKSIRHGHPSTLHLWWARRPLAAARAVIFSQMVDDPSAYTDELLSDPVLRQAARDELDQMLAEHKAKQSLAKESVVAEPEPTLEEAAAAVERKRLFEIIEALVKWENTTNEAVLQQARDEIWRSWRRACADNAGNSSELFNPEELPAFHDPFAGGGSLPLEAQRLGLEAYASDLNPVAVLINKAMIEIPPKFAGMPPVNPESRRGRGSMGTQWKGAAGLAEDVRYYGKWMRDEAEKSIGHLYPKVVITARMASERPDLKAYVGRELTVIAWLWARTVKSPNPAFRDVDVPLASTFMLSTKPGKEAYVEPVIENGGYRFAVKVGKPHDPEAAKNGTKLSRGANFRCVMSDSPIGGDYIKAQGRAGRMSARLMAIVAEGERSKVFLSPSQEQESIAALADPLWRPEGRFVEDARAFTPFLYGLNEWARLFTNRQTVALTALSDLLVAVSRRIAEDFGAAGLRQSAAAEAYAAAVGTYLACALDRCADYWSTLAVWAGEFVAHTFGRQALSMTWDFAECNPLSDSTGNLLGAVEWVQRVVERLPAGAHGEATQDDAATQKLSLHRVVSTDPPYYDNVPYADLSDFFYVWLRKALHPAYPDLFATLAAPKSEELVATSYRHNGPSNAEEFFLAGMTRALGRLSQAHPAYPVTVYYAFKQSETDGNGGVSSTGWETFLAAVVGAGLTIDGTWPVRTERQGRLRDNASNALASSVVLACRPRPTDAPTATRGQFAAALKAELPPALKILQQGNIAPVDLAQAAIGPGMAVFTRYASVLGASGEAMRVQEALALINQVLDEALAEQEGDFDADSRWALAWFEQVAFNDGQFGVAESLSKAKNTSIDGLEDAGILKSGRGVVRLLRPSELSTDWDPEKDRRLTAWESVHQLVRALETGGETAAGALAAKLGSPAEAAPGLCYRLYTLCERKKRASEALSYNALVQSWPEIMRLAQETPRDQRQGTLI